MLNQLRSWWQRLSPAALWRRLSLLPGKRSGLELRQPMDPGYLTSRLCPTVALQRVPVRPERRRPYVR